MESKGQEVFESQVPGFSGRADETHKRIYYDIRS
jgi:hypothetical protein